MLTLVLADAELEPVPPNLLRHPAVRASVRRRGRSPEGALLDSSLHHPALKRYPDGERRGRPDIVHISLLIALDSVLNLEGRLRVLVHTRNDEAIQVAAETRLPKNYVRFCGLIEDLFAKGDVPAEAPLLHLERGVSLEQLLARLGGEAWAFTEGGPAADLTAEFATAPEDLVAVIGAFPHGSFRSPVQTLCKRTLTLHPQPLKAWTVASEILTSYRRARPAPKS